MTDCEYILTLVAHGRIVTCDVEPEPSEAVRVSVQIDGEFVWSSIEPGWRRLGLGVAANVVYFWSARRLVALALSERGPAYVVDVEDDLLYCIAHGDNYVLVCETSLHLAGPSGIAASIQLPEVVESAKWRQPVLRVREASGMTRRITVSGESLHVVDD